MIKNIVCPLNSVNRKHTLYYLRVTGEPDERLNELLDECERELLPVLTPKAVFNIFDLVADGNNLSLGFARVQSAALAKNLSGCSKIAVFAATLGVGIDRLIIKYQKIAPSKASVFQAMGAAAIEQVCNYVCDCIKEEYKNCKPRFSCGFGDLDISLQRSIFSALSVEKRIGVTLSDNYFMTPTKSVTAIVGIL